jgi:hypothetical protein
MQASIRQRRCSSVKYSDAGRGVPQRALNKIIEKEEPSRDNDSPLTST